MQNLGLSSDSLKASDTRNVVASWPRLQSRICMQSAWSNRWVCALRVRLKVTKMLLLVSTVFLVLNTPSHAVRVYAFLKSTVNPSYVPHRLLVLVQKIIQHLFYVNFATNFLLYSASGKAFRRATYRLLWCTARRVTLWAQRLRRLGRSTPLIVAPNIVVEPPSHAPPQSSSGDLFGDVPLESPYN